MRRAVLALACSGTLLFAASGPALAQCQLSATGVNFGSYDPLSSQPLSAVGSVTYFCAPPNRPVVMSLNHGLSGTYAARQMASGAERLAYNLHLDGACTTVWGDGTAGTSVYSGTTGPPGPPAGRTFTVPVYGRVPPDQDVAAGVYSDVITVTIVF